MGLLTRARQTMLRWARDPVDFVTNELHVDTLDSFQVEGLRAVAAPAHDLRLALKACKGPGKSAFLAWVGLWFLVTRPHAKIGATSITEGNLNANLWPEFSKWGQRSDFCRAALTFGTSRIALAEAPALAFIDKRAWPKSGDPDAQSNALAGFHGDHVMWLGDETGGYPQGVMVAMEAIFSSCVEGKIIQAGNPTHTTGPLHRACTTDRALWHVLTITGDPDDPQRSRRIDLTWARQQIHQYGRDNPWVMVNVLGQFPPASINSLLSVEEVEAAMKRHLSPNIYAWSQKRISIDVARFGDDRTVIWPRQGLASFRPIVMRNARTTEIAARAMQAFSRWKAELLLVDDTGHWGHGVVDNLVTAGVPCIPINYAGKALNPRYKNRRVEFWLKGADEIKNGAALPYIPEMIPELTEPTYTFVGGQFVLEEKDQIKLRLGGHSPDYADAFMQSYALEDMPADVLGKLGKPAHAVTADDLEAMTRQSTEIGQNGRAEMDSDPFQ
jgi:hypothetical protein